MGANSTCYPPDVRAGVVSFAIVLFACGSSAIPAAQSPVIDAGNEETAADPFPTNTCELLDYPVSGHVIDCEGGPCTGRSLAPGASCADLQVGTFCDLGDHPATRTASGIVCTLHVLPATARAR